MNKLFFITQSTCVGDLGHLTLSADKLTSFLFVTKSMHILTSSCLLVCHLTLLNLDIMINHKFELAKPNYPSLWIEFTVGVFSRYQDMTSETNWSTILVITTDVQLGISALNTLLMQKDIIKNPDFFSSLLAHLSKIPQLLIYCGSWFNQQFTTTSYEGKINNVILAHLIAIEVTPIDHNGYLECV